MSFKSVCYWLCLVGAASCPLIPIEAQQLPQQFSPSPEQTSQAQEALTIKEVIFIGSTAFSSKELEAIKAPYLGKTGTLQEIQADIQAMVQAINDLYLSRGYIGSGAYFPPQDLDDGIIRLQVVEGKLEKLEISGLNRLNQNYVRERLLLATSPPLNLQRLQYALQLLQINPLFESVKAELKTGTSPELRILAVEITEAPALNASVQFDNYESPSIGQDQGTASIEDINLLGWGDRFRFEYNLTEGLDNRFPPVI